MNARKYRDRIRFEVLAAGRDPEYGTPLPAAWTPLPGGEVWAEIKDVMPSKGESEDEGLQLVRGATRVRIRYREDITAAMRIVELTGRKRALSIITEPAALFNNSELEFMAERFSS